MPRFTVRLPASVLAVTGLVLGLTLVPALSSQALPADVPPGSPGAGYVYGWSPSQFPSIVDRPYYKGASNCLTAGGNAAESHWPTNGGPQAGSGARSLGVVLACDPFTDWDNSNNAGYYGINLRLFQLADTRNPSVGVRVVAGKGSMPDGTGHGSAVCAQSQWSLPADNTTIPILTGGSAQTDDNQVSDHEFHGTVQISQQYRGCPFLVSYTFTVVTYNGFSSKGIDNNVSWSALQAASPRKYMGDSDPKIACTQPMVTVDMSPSCADIIASQPQHWCDFPPQIQWTSDNWTNYANWIPLVLGNVGPTVAYYGRCLFIPKNGMDADGVVSTAFTSGPLGRVNTAFTGITTGFNVSSSCGSLFPVQSTGPLKGFDLNTCGWPLAFINPVHSLLYLMILGLSGFWLVNKFIEITLSIVNRKVVLPTAKKSDD